MPGAAAALFGTDHPAIGAHEPHLGRGMARDVQQQVGAAPGPADVQEEGRVRLEVASTSWDGFVPRSCRYAARTVRLVEDGVERVRLSLAQATPWACHELSAEQPSGGEILDMSVNSSAPEVPPSRPGAGDPGLPRWHRDGSSRGPLPAGSDPAESPRSRSRRLPPAKDGVLAAGLRAGVVEIPVDPLRNRRDRFLDAARISW